MSPWKLTEHAQIEAIPIDPDGTDEHLRRAASTNYYAIFHAVCNAVADLWVGEDEISRGSAAWKNIYRAVNHRALMSACKNEKWVSTFPEPFQNFASILREAQDQRHLADYDPFAEFDRDAVIKLINLAQKAIEEFYETEISDRRAFLAGMMFKIRN